MAGFPGRQGNYFLPRAELTPPAGLQQLVWPWLKTWVKCLKERARGKKSERGGLDTDDLMLLGFVELLGELRIVFLQDAAVLQRQFPGSLLWTAGLFVSLLWLQFASAVQHSLADAMIPHSILLQSALPEISDALYQHTELLVDLQWQNHATAMSLAECLQQDIHSLLSGQVSINSCPLFLVI